MEQTLWLNVKDLLGSGLIPFRFPSLGHSEHLKICSGATMQLQWANSWHSTSSAGNAHIIHCLAATEVAARTQTGSGSPQIWIRMPLQEDKSSLYLQASSSALFRLALTFSTLLMAVWISSDTNQQKKIKLISFMWFKKQTFKVGFNRHSWPREWFNKEKSKSAGVQHGLPQRIHQIGTTLSRPRPLLGERIFPTDSVATRWCSVIWASLV